jgi:hypothetical protein
MPQTNFNLDEETLKFEKEKVDREFLIKEREIELRKREVELKEKEFQKTKWGLLDPASPIWLAVIGVIGTFIGAWLQGSSNESLERKKFESELILKTATSNDIEQNSKNLKFLLDAGFITEGKDSIKKMLSIRSYDFKVSTSKILMDESKREYLNKMTSTGIDYVNNVRNLINTFDLILNYKMDIDTFFGFSSIDTIFLNYDRSYAFFADTSVIRLAINSYWKNTNIDTVYSDLVRFGVEEVNPSIDSFKLQLNKDLVAYRNDKSPSNKSKVLNTIKSQTTKIMQKIEQLNFKVTNFYQVSGLD